MVAKFNKIIALVCCHWFEAIKFKRHLDLKSGVSTDSPVCRVEVQAVVPRYASFSSGAERPGSSLDFDIFSAWLRSVKVEKYVTLVSGLKNKSGLELAGVE